MELAAFLGMATKYAEGLLAVKYRVKDENGNYLGGPFYYIEKGLGKKWRPMAKLFAAFGAVAGLMYALLPRKWRAGRVYAALLIAMVAGRVVYAVVYFLLLKTGLVAVDQAFLLFVWTRAVVKPILGIVLQILLVPVLVLALERAGLTLNKGRKTE